MEMLCKPSADPVSEWEFELHVLWIRIAGDRLVVLASAALRFWDVLGLGVP